jgi:hypothetical protein
MLSSEELKELFVYKLFLRFVYEFIAKFYNLKIINKHNIHNGDQSCIYISRHTTHNYELMLGLFSLNKFSKKPVRGLGHYLIYFLAPWYVLLGVVSGSRKNALELIRNEEYIFVIPGGGEEMSFGSESFYKCYWYSKSKKYKTGFAKLACDNNLPVIPIHGRNCEYMVFSPAIYVCNKLGLTKAYSNFMDNIENIVLYKVLFYIKMFFTAVFGSLLVIPVRTNIELIIGNKIIKEKNETLLEFTKRCEKSLNKLLRQ